MAGDPLWPKRFSEDELRAWLRKRYPTSLEFLLGLAADENWYRDAVRERWAEAAAELKAAEQAGEGAG